jgi:putative transposase
MTSTTKSPYAGYRFPGEVISHAVWLYFRFPLSLRMVEEMLAARGIAVSHETVRQWARKFGQGFANQIRRRLPSPGDKWPGLRTRVNGGLRSRLGMTSWQR